MAFQFPSEDLDSLQVFLHLPKATMKSLIKELQASPPALYFNVLASQLTEKVALSTHDMQRILRVIGNLYSTYIASGTSVEKFIGDFQIGLQQTGVPTLSLTEAEWDEFRGYLSQILMCERSVGITSKALKVMTDHSHVFRDAQILTDLRPVFRSNAEEPPDAAVIVHTLKIEFSEVGQRKRFFVALDSLDLKRLEASIKRAKLKEKSLKDMFKDMTLSILDPR